MFFVFGDNVEKYKLVCGKFIKTLTNNGIFIVEKY
jgi:hypothetical protein